MNKCFKRIVILAALLFIPFIRVNAETITNINITGVEKPIIGQHPSIEGVIVNTPGITLRTIQWDLYPDGNNIDEEDTFLATRYGLYISYELNAGYDLASNFTVSANEEYNELDYRETDYFYLVYTAKHEVNFETNGGSVLESQYIVDNGVAVKPALDPEKAGASFAGWYANEALTTPYDFTTPVTSSKTIYAKWNTLISELRITSEVTNVEQGNLLPYEVATTTEHVELEPFGSNTNWMKWAAGMSSWHGFGGENTIAIADGTTHYALRVKVEPASSYYMNNTTKIYFNGEDVTNEGHTTLDCGFPWGCYAYIDLGLAVDTGTAVYTVSFDMNGVVASSISPKYVVAGSLVMPPEEPSNPLFRFDAWYKESACVNVFEFEDDKINSNITLYAGWIPLSNTVTFDLNGGSFRYNDDNPVIVDHGGKVSEPKEAIKENSVFVGWYSDPELTIPFDFNEPIMTNVTIYAKWNTIIYSLAATIDAPVGGEHPDFHPVAVNSEEYRVEFVKWYHMEPEYTELTEDDVYVKGRDYHVEIRFVANEGYVIASAANYYINDTLSPTAYQTGHERGLEFMAIPPVGETIEIDSLDITGIVAPRASLTPKTANLKITNRGANIKNAFWIDETAEKVLSETDKFVEKKKYILVIEFEPDEYYSFVESIGKEYITTNAEYLMADFIGDRQELRIHYEAGPAPILSSPKATISADNSSLTLSWNEQDGVTKAEVYRSNSKTKGYKKVATVTTNSYKNTGLTYGKTYYYKVRVYNGTKWSGYSNIVSKKVVPNKVANLRVLTQGPNNIKVGWNKIGVTGYELQRSTNNKKWSSIKTITKNSTLNFNNTKLSVNKTYYYRVRAYKKVGSKKVYGGWSTVLVAKTTPAKPTLSLSMKDVNEVYIKIGKASGATTYVVERSLDGSTYTLYDTLTAAATLTNMELTTGNRYYYRVKGCNGTLCSPWVSSSIISSTKTPGLTLKTSSKKVTVTVTPVTGATGYEVYRSVYKNKKYSKIKTLLTADEVLTFINSTSKGKTYYYKVRAYVELEDKKVYSSYSSVKSIRSK